LGLGLGVVTGMPIAVINVAIVDAVTAGRRRFAAGLALGGAAADTIHALLAFAGIGRVMIADPALVRGLAIAAAATIVGYVGVTWRRRARTLDARVARQPPPQPDHDAPPVRGLATGFLLTLPNPGALAAWVAVAAAVWPDAAPLEAAVIAGAVGAGSALWFTLLARWIGRVRRDHPVLSWAPRAAAIVLVAVAAAGVVRAL